MKVDVGDYFYYLLYPRPVVLIVTSSDEKTNVMTCSWNMPVAEEPPLVAIAVSKESFTSELIDKAGEFTINIPTKDLLKAVMIAGTKSGRKVDKVKLMKITLKPSKKVKPPIIEECVGHLECKVTNKIEAGECMLYVAEVLEAYANKDIFRKGWLLDKVEIPHHFKSSIFTIPKQTVRVK